MPFTPSAHRGTLHHFAPRLFAFEHASRTDSLPSPQQQGHQPSESQPQHTLLFLGGLGDDLMHPTYPSKLPRHLPPHWTVAEVHLSSSGPGWATSALPRDADELAAAVAYFRALRPHPAARVALMGHSTGSQACMEYLTQAPAAGARHGVRPRVDGVVLQGCASDREGLAHTWGAAGLRRALDAARAEVGCGRGEEVLDAAVTGLVMGASPTARRFVSLADVGGGDDYFSSDLGLAAFRRTFGRVGSVGVPMLCLLSERDEHMPPGVDKEALLATWREVVEGEGGVWSGESGVVNGASHNLNKNEASVVEDLAGRVARFLGSITKSTASSKEERL